MNDDDTPVLELAGLHKRFGTFVALEQVDLTLAPGRILGLLGPNGAGKTTTLRMITGLMRPTAGTIRVCGHDLAREPTRARAQIGFVSDRPFLYEKLTGDEFLRFVGGLWGMSHNEIEARSALWLERFDLTAWAGEPIEAYSHGMRQRILFCSALIHRPRLLILDEPMVGLDPRGARHLKAELRRLAADEGMAVILSTHTLDVVEAVCDEVAIIHRGVVVAAGPLDQVRRAHGHEADGLEELFLRITGGEAGTAPRDVAGDAAKEQTRVTNELANDDTAEPGGTG